ncbi:hypothetical protein CSUI_009210 [Cystoisospora suis]|uniref:Uncharacterized protein n=1 Tax=Cystoisospora suis TaxID=483139 RepID=A0A2C6KKH7_9APIC|nr:hypothetical protein CSUI_009210 [Cystoisospora suis]
MKIKKKRFKDDEANRRKKSRHTRDDGSEGSDEEEEEEEENANRDVRSSSISEEEATSALVCAANLLFHCVDQPLFNIHARDFKICSPPPLPLSGRKRRRGPTAGTVSSTASLNDTALDEREGLLQPTKSVGDLSSSSSSDSLLNAVDNEGTSSLVASSCKETDPLWSSLMEAAVQFCTQQEEEEEEEEEEQEEEEEEEETSRSRNSNKKRRMDGKGKRRLRERKGRGKEDEDERDRKSCKENEELKKKKKKEKWRVPGLDLFGAFVVVRIQQLFTSTRGKADCHQMLTQVVQEWREAAAALGKRKDEDEEEEEEKKTDNDEDRREKKGDKEKTQQDSKKTQLLLSLHGQLQQMYAHMAAAAKMTALLSLLQSNCPSLIPRPPQHLSLQQLLDFQQILQKQGEALRMKLEKEHFTEIKSLVKEEKEE